MKDIIEYLKNPMNKGVYNQILKINIKEMGNILNISDILYDENFFIINFATYVADLMYKEPFDEFYNVLDTNSKLVDSEIQKSIIKIKWDKEDAKYYTYLEQAENIFKTRILKNKLDVIHYDDITKRIAKNKLLKIYEITSIKKDTLYLFKNFLKKILHIDETFEITKERFTHSSRYVYRLYTYALELWFKDESSIYIPKDLINLIKAASEYHREKEWRTSVIISAIVIESILADIYEEEKKENAPDVPLGVLFEQVKKIAKIPNEIQSVISAVNQARIASVHRSKSPVSDRDADIALYGTTKTIMWFVKNY